MYCIAGADSRDLSAAWIPDGEDNYVLAVYINDCSQAGSSLGDAVPEKVTQMTNKINELFGSQVMDPTQAGAAPVPMPVEEGVADAMEKTVNEAMNSETKETEVKEEE